MLKIRLARHGSKKRPFYHIVVADARAPRDGKFIEKLGTYNPMLAKGAQRVSLNIDAVKKWLKDGAKPTERVKRFLGEAGMKEFKYVAPTNQTKQDKPKAKAVERAKEKEEKLAAAKEAEAEAKRQAEEEAKAAAEAPVEEAKEEVVAETPAEEKSAETSEEAPVEEKAEEVKEEAPAE